MTVECLEIDSRVLGKSDITNDEIQVTAYFSSITLISGYYVRETTVGLFLLKRMNDAAKHKITLIFRMDATAYTLQRYCP